MPRERPRNGKKKKKKKKTKETHYWSSHCGSVETNLTSIREDTGLIPGLAQWVKDPMLLWLWCRLAATTPIRPLAWELPHAMGAALKKQKEKKLNCIFENC